VTPLRTAVAVVGAGAAGLAAARSLHERGVDFLLLEARDRAGGRAYTLASQHGEPVELGAEFIHGEAASTRQLMRAIDEPVAPVGGHRFRVERGHLEPAPDRWDVIERVLHRVDLRGPDTSVAAFLDALPPGELSAPEREDVSAMLEGFDAALLDDASIIGIAKEWRSGVNDTAHRPLHGYAPVIDFLARVAGDRLHLRTRVTRIAWSPGHVRIEAVSEGKALQIDAHAAIVTLPIGALQHETDLFDPPLPARKRAAIDAIAMGPVVKVALEFRTPFWEDVEGGRYRDASFFQAPHGSLRTLWTRVPDRQPLLYGWAGGGAVLRLRSRDADPVHAALQTVATLFPRVDVLAELHKTYYHDWQADPFARGAYSFLRVGAADARERLAEPVDETLFFAGEATSSDDAGTVAGAFDSGYQSSRRIAR